jgi:hypothetical protein
MAFEIVPTERSLPSRGPSVFGRPSTDTGGDLTSRALGQFGGALGKVGEDLYRVQGEAELTQKMFEANETFQNLHKELLTETDPEKYEPKFEEAWQKVENVEIKNAWARRRYRLAMPDYRMSQQTAVAEAYAKRVKENHKMAVSYAEAQAVRSGNLNSLTSLLNTEVEEGYMLPEHKELLIETTALEAQDRKHGANQQALSKFAYEDPETVLSWKTADDMQKAFPDAIPTDLTWIQGVAQDALNIGNRQKQLKLNKYSGMIHQLAADSIDSIGKNISPDQTTTVPAVIKKIISLDLEPQETTALLDEYNDAVKVWGQSGVNPYKETMNYTVKEQMKNDAIDGKLTEKQIRDAIGRDISSSDADELRRLIKGEGASKALENTAAGKILDDLWNGYQKESFEKTEKIDWLKEESLRLLEDAIAGNPDMTDREKKEQSMRIYLNLKIRAEAGNIEFVPEALTGAYESGRSLDKAVAENIKYQKTSPPGLEGIWDNLDADSKKGALDLLAQGERPEDLIAFYKRKQSENIEYRGKSPEGLESIWAELNQQEKATALAALNRGIAAEKIIEIFNRNK